MSRSGREQTDEPVIGKGDHGARVDAWMERVARGQPPEHVVQAFEQGFAALWRRAHRTLGNVTLTAIVDRVLISATEQHPFLSALQFEATGLRCQKLLERAGSLPPGELERGIRFMLVELLTVLGNLTAEILTGVLHAELSGSAPGGEPGKSEARGGPPVPGGKDGEGTLP